ncbi:DEAD/DEAH box helicase [Sutcliffiella halmapala]|uniref:DEAD/DEAH box helicase n=1 Tax=Sutcliffiella halmapala TaxID=79882 RepID=UPI000994D49B|nr:DEAD/DEAH box helicase [Sutcliffiella halmapala]
MRFQEKNKILIPDIKRKFDDSRKISDFPHLPHPLIKSPYSYSSELQQFLSGKRLLHDELPFPFSEIQEHYEQGHISYSYGVLNGLCYRCGNSAKSLMGTFQCARCQGTCMYCRKCIMMGRVSECTPLISWCGPELSYERNSNLLNWKGTLSKGQQQASDKVVQSVKERASVLVWAVCGAGKTEVLFDGIRAALTERQRVCIATPRTDVVLELSPRLQQVFPSTEIATLYGGSEDRTKNAPLTIATTHQLLRYYHAFDTIVIDEVDAFPYSMEPMLQHAANEARKEDGTIIYLSATPSKEMQRDVSRKNLPCVVIPARYHGKPLPVPTFEWCGNWRTSITKNKLPRNVSAWIARHYKENKPIFLFVPNIKLLEKIVEFLKMSYGEEVEGVHSKDKERKEKVARFREGTVRILVTTTILERGVTVSNVQVAVLGAEDTIFTESALVQIAGRAGRNAKFATGEVRLFHYGKTNEMVAARDHIKRMNYRAKHGGFLKGDRDE